MHKRWVLGATGKQLLKSAHLIVSVVWLGAAISMNMLRVGWTPSANGDLYAVDHAIAVIDNWVVVPAAFAAVITGLLESWLTTWGFFRFRWVSVKWILTLAAMVFAPVFIAPLDRDIQTMSQAAGLLALQNPVYLYDRQLYTIFGVGLITVLTFMSVISTLKPWTRGDRLNARTRARPAISLTKAEDEPRPLAKKTVS